MTLRKRPLQVKSYVVVQRAVEEGIACGLRRANKYADDPQSDETWAAFAEHLEREIMNALCDVIDFP